MNVYSDDDEQMRTCPNCGQGIPVQSTVCGYCGHDFSGRFSGAPQPLAQRSSGWFSGLRTLFIVVPFLAITAFILFIGFEVDGLIDDAFNSVPDVNEAIDDATGGSSSGKSTITGKGSYKNARTLVADLNKNGLKCNQFDLVTENTALQAASCLSGTDPLTIQVMYDQLSYDSIVSGYKKQKDLNVAYGTNWTVITPTPQLAKKVARALDGKTN